MNYRFSHIVYNRHKEIIMNCTHKSYVVRIQHEGEQATIPCVNRKDAEVIRQSFLNYGKYNNVSIVETVHKEEE